ncbi:MAG: MurR/RpiR family transcriptional regulator [Bacillota bacterium]
MFYLEGGEEKNDTLLGGSLVRIREVYSSLRPAEQRVADHVLQHPRDVIHLSVAELAVKAEVSEATIVRFCQAIGYGGYQKFKMSLAQDLVVPTQFIPEQIKAADDLQTIAAKIAHSNLQAINDTRDILDLQEVEKAVTAICKARRVEFYGVGFSGLVAQDAHLRLARIGIPAISYVDPHLQANSAALLEKGDVAVGISLLGKTADILYSMKLAKDAGATTVAITKYAKTPIAELADIKLFTSTEDEAFRTGAARIAQLHVVDILFAAVAVRRYDLSLKCLEKTKKVGIDKRVK